jgi:hypothetical protein
LRRWEVLPAELMFLLVVAADRAVVLLERDKDQIGRGPIFIPDKGKSGILSFVSVDRFSKTVDFN